MRKRVGLVIMMGMLMLWAGSGLAAQQITDQAVDLVALKGLLSKAEVIVPEVNAKVKLKNGQAEYTQKSEHIKITLGKIIGQSKDTNGSSEIYAEIIIKKGGPEEFHYVGLFLMTGNKVEHTSSVLIGDRVNMLAASHLCTQDQKVCLVFINYQDRYVGQEMTALPTHKAEKIFKITGHQISQ